MQKQKKYRGEVDSAFSHYPREGQVPRRGE